MKELAFDVQPITEVPDDVRVTAVFAYITNSDGHVVAIEGERGIDCPGGHVEPGETPLQALEREILEEAAVTMDDIQLRVAATRQVNGTKTAMLFYTARLRDMLPFTGEYETTGRVILTRDDLVRAYGGGMPKLFAQVMGILAQP
jgi:8-oxo-dGTP diphosphatase